jgi:hypothetical protein
MADDIEPEIAKRREGQRRWRLANAEYNRERQLRWRLANAEHIRAYQRERMSRWRAANSEANCELGRVYDKRRRQRDPAKHKAKVRKWILANLEKHRATKRANAARHREANREKRRLYIKEWRKANPEKFRLYIQTRDRKRRAGKANPKWADRDAIAAIYAACPPGMVIDHIVPLRGRTFEGHRISGLHVPWNLQRLTKEENGRKYNQMRREDQELCEGSTVTGPV